MLISNTSLAHNVNPRFSPTLLPLMDPYWCLSLIVSVMHSWDECTPFLLKLWSWIVIWHIFPDLVHWTVQGLWRSQRRRHCQGTCSSSSIVCNSERSKEINTCDLCCWVYWLRTVWWKRLYHIATLFSYGNNNNTSMRALINIIDIVNDNSSGDL